MTAAPREQRAAGQPGRRPRGPIRMGTPVEKAKDVRGALRRLFGYLRPHRIQLGTVVIMSILSTGFSVLGPKLIGNAITKLFEGSMLKVQGVPGAQIDFGYISRILGVLAGLYVVSAFFSYLQQYLIAGIAQKTVYALRKDVNEKLARLPLRFFDTWTHGDILSRATNDVDNIATVLQQSTTQLITSVVTIVGVIIMMLTISPWLTLIVFVTLPLSVLVTTGVSSRSQRLFVRQQATLGRLNSHVEEMYSGHKIVKAFGREEQSVAAFNRINAQLYESGWKAQFISGLIMPLLGLVSNLGYVLICIVGGIFVARQSMTIGDVQAFIQYARQFSLPIVQTATIANVLQLAAASAERIFELLDQQEQIPDCADAKRIAHPRGEVRFDHVTFGYTPDAPLIKDLRIDVRSGQTIAIVGPTGAGKTTLVNLLMRFYEIDGGKITVDGIDIREMRRGDLRSLFGMVLQDTWLFNGTIKDNIGYGRPGATMQEVVRAATAAHADHFIRTLPDGYDTILNEEASNISQGQKQLLTIARAILADPVILILDEATSSVDTRTELLIQKAMGTLMQGRTSFVIAHRLSTIRDADVILVMQRGSVIEQGTHTELLEQGGFYVNLYNSQFLGDTFDRQRAEFQSGS